MVSRRIRLRTCKQLFVFCVAIAVVLLPSWRAGLTRGDERNIAYATSGAPRGYAWRHNYTQAVLDIWCHEDAPPENPDRDIETIEAEVVFLARLAGQWPAGQTEIHFHPSAQEHREAAARIW